MTHDKKHVQYYQQFLLKNNMENYTIIDYLTDHCCCSPNTDDYTSVCGFSCNAKWHWKEEIDRFKLKMSLGKKYDPPEILVNSQ